LGDQSATFIKAHTRDVPYVLIKFVSPCNVHNISLEAPHTLFADTINQLFHLWSTNEALVPAGRLIKTLNAPDLNVAYEISATQEAAYALLFPSIQPKEVIILRPNGKDAKPISEQEYRAELN